MVEPGRYAGQVRHATGEIEAGSEESVVVSRVCAEPRRFRPWLLYSLCAAGEKVLHYPCDGTSIFGNEVVADRKAEQLAGGLDGEEGFRVLRVRSVRVQSRKSNRVVNAGFNSLGLEE